MHNSVDRQSYILDIPTRSAWRNYRTMGVNSMPTPPSEEVSRHIPQSPASSRRSTAGSLKSVVKPTNRISKRASIHASSRLDHAALHGTHHVDNRHKRVWKACERCRTKKTKVRFLFICNVYFYFYFYFYFWFCFYFHHFFPPPSYGAMRRMLLILATCSA